MTTTAAVTEVFARVDIVVIGHNPELADMGNPRGEVYGYRADLIAEAPDGSRWVYNVKSWTARHQDDCAPAAMRQAERLNNLLGEGFTLNPARWDAIEPCFGTEAYEAASADIAALEKADTLFAEGYYEQARNAFDEHAWGVYGISI
jgi:hypothetical protein